MSTSTTMRRAGPPLAAATVLLLLLGVVWALRSSGPGTGDAASRQGSGPGDDGTATALRLTDLQLPPAGAAIEPQFHLAGDLADDPPDPVAVQWLRRPAPDAQAELARSLGLSGSGRAEGGARVFGSGSATLRVQDTPGGQWQYAAGDAITCPPHPTVQKTPTSKGGPSLAITCDVQPGGPGTPSPTSTSGGSGAVPPNIDAALPVLRAAGIDPSQRVERPGGGDQATVLGEPTVADLPTSDATTVVRVSGTRVADASGWLLSAREGADYPLVSATAAWDRLRRTPLPQTLIACTEPLAPGVAPLSCGGPITVTGARLGLSLQHEDSRALLVPSWLFRVRGSDQELPVVALPRRLIAQPRLPTGAATAPAPSAPSAPTTAGSQFTAVRRAGPDTLTVEFTGGVSSCYSYRVVVGETDQRVRLSLVEKAGSNRRCIAMAQEYARRVQLKAPLGDRPVVDARSGVVLLTGSR